LPVPLDHVDVWIFDLDNTLYPSHCNLFVEVEQLIRKYVQNATGLPPDEAYVLQKEYFMKYGTTMNGLMAEHGVDPAHYLSFVHQIDYSPIPADPALDAALHKIDAKKYIFTNGTVAHAEEVLDRIGVAHHFESTFDIAASSYIPKPNDHFYDTFLEAHGIEPKRAILVEDLARNLKPAHDRGMTTLHIHTDNEWAMDGHADDHVHHSTADLVNWLERVIAVREDGDLRQRAG
jgi:putative hydrolase of the HAD superfamily